MDDELTSFCLVLSSLPFSSSTSTFTKCFASLAAARDFATRMAIWTLITADYDVYIYAYNAEQSCTLRGLKACLLIIRFSFFPEIDILLGAQNTP